MIVKSNALLTLFNILLIFLSFPVIAIGIIFAHDGLSCSQFLGTPLVLLGALLLLASSAGISGVCFRSNLLLGFYLTAYSAITLLLLCFTSFELALSGREMGQKVAEAEFREYRLDSYPVWIQRRIVGAERWRDVKKCLIEYEVCGYLEKTKKNERLKDFLRERLAPVESGCCKPPMTCGFIYQNPTNWTKPYNNISAHNNDCSIWNNYKNELCYDCDSCKAGVIARFQMKWYNAVLAKMIVLVMFLVVYFMVVQAFKNNRRINPRT